MSLSKTGFINLTSILNPLNFKGYRGLALKQKDLQKIDEFQEKLKLEVSRNTNLEIKKSGVVY